MNGTVLEEVDYEALAAEADYEEAMAVAYQPVRLVRWSEIRREIMRRGGLSRGCYSRFYLPGQTYRVKGMPVDVIAADLRDEGWGTWEDGEEFIALLWTLFGEFQQEKAAQRMRGMIRRQNAAAKRAAKMAAKAAKESDGGKGKGRAVPQVRRAEGRSLGAGRQQRGEVVQMPGLRVALVGGRDAERIAA